ncbi:unnamed protein product [Rhodiola kirilowii]
MGRSLWNAASRRTLFLASKLTKGLVPAFCRSLVAAGT